MILQKLRESTRSAHEAVEKSLELMSPTVTLDRYTEILARFHSIYSKIEKPLEENLRAVSFPVSYEIRRKLPLLDYDLSFFGQKPAEQTPSIAPIFEHSRAIGLLYVVEGSTLGGQVLSRHFREKLGLTPESGCRFFHGYGEKTRENWMDFLHALSQADPKNSDEICQGAVDGFYFFSKELAQ